MLTEIFVIIEVFVDFCDVEMLNKVLVESDVEVTDLFFVGCDCFVGVGKVESLVSDDFDREVIKFVDFGL